LILLQQQKHHHHHSAKQQNWKTKQKLFPWKKGQSYSFNKINLWNIKLIKFNLTLIIFALVQIEPKWCFPRQAKMVAKFQMTRFEFLEDPRRFVNVIQNPYGSSSNDLQWNLRRLWIGFVELKRNVMTRNIAVFCVETASSSEQCFIAVLEREFGTIFAFELYWEFFKNMFWFQLAVKSNNRASLIFLNGI